MGPLKAEIGDVNITKRSAMRQRFLFISKQYNIETGKNEENNNK